MKIDGKAIAERTLDKLTLEVSLLKDRGIIPTLAVILVGDNPASLAYIKQKQKAAERIGANIVFRAESLELSKEQLELLIAKYNNDSTIQGLIVQRPLPKILGDVSDILLTVKADKDVDGFLPNSPYSVPVALAVLEMLRSTGIQNLIKKRVVVIGRGETAGKPIAVLLAKLGYKVTVVHSQTSNPNEIMKSADIIVSCVGKERVITSDIMKPGAILISVGIWRDQAGKLRGDYDEEDIGRIASFYTPTPGGVGPVNVACLMQNLVLAAKNSH